MPPSLRRLLLRAPLGVTLAGLVLVSVATSVGMMFALNVIMGIGFGHTFKRSLTIAIVAPMLVSGPIGGLVVRLLREVESARQTAQRLAWYDALTEVVNRRRFVDLLEAAITTAREHGRPMSAVLLDLDDFKRVNDLYGHAAGDALLREVAQALVRCVRADDTVARWGGEEFAILLPDADAADALQVMQRVRAAVASVRVFDHGAELRCTASIGVATLGGDGFDALLIRADRAMYRAKREGKNRVTLADAA